LFSCFTAINSSLLYRILIVPYTYFIHRIVTYPDVTSNACYHHVEIGNFKVSIRIDILKRDRLKKNVKTFFFFNEISTNVILLENNIDFVMINKPITINQ
jgi:hypothetical protein